MAYRADIEIGVKGQEAIGRLQKQLDGTLYKINELNKTSVFRTGNVAQNIDRYVKQLNIANKAINLAALSTEQETRAYNNKARALGNLNAAQARSNYLLEQAIANQRKVQATVNAGFGQQGPAVPPSMRNAGFGQFGPALPPKAGATKPGAGIGKGIMGAASNAAIGGAFPLLFGQSGTAAAGGALGGIAGSFLGPSGGFAGSLIGTILGEKLGQGNQVKQLGEDIGFSAEQTKMLGTAFQQAGRDFDKFQQSVSTIQGLSLSIEDQAKAIQLASSLTETYKGKIDKVTNAFANALSTGKVTQGTLNKLTNEGIPIQQALADKYNVSRSAIIQMAKDGQISVQDLIDTLVEVGNEAQKVGAKQVDPFIAASEAIGTAATNLNTALAPAYAYVTAEVAKLIQKIADLTTGVANFITYATPAIGTVVNAFDSINTAIGNAALNIPNLNASISNFAQAAYISLFPVAALVDHIAKQGKGPGFLGHGKYAAPSDQMRTPTPLKTFSAPSQAAASGGSSGADKAAKAAEREAERVANIVRDRAAATEQLRLQMQYSHGIFVAELAKDPILRAQIEGQQKLGQISIEYSKQINDERAKGNSAAVIEAITKETLVKTELQQLATAQELATIEAKSKENYANILADLQLEYDLKYATTEEARTQLQIAYEMAKLKQQGLKDDQLAEIQRKKQENAKPKSSRDIIAGRIEQIKSDIKELTKISTIATTVANGVGTAFGNAFKGLVDGSMSAREALSGFFKDVANMFLDMATQIIAQQVAMITYQLILKALGVVAGAASAGSSAIPGAAPQMTPGSVVTPTGFSGQFAGIAANGAYFSNGVAAFATGGIVNSPTMFKFANGATTQTGLMGEAGPEAIMPLSRDAGGKLGVNASGLREAMGSSSGMSGAPVLNMTFETVRFGDTEYVSRDQLEMAMAQTRRQAASDGAKRGMSMTLDKLQQSPQTRNRVGIR